MNLDEFIREARQVHGDDYDYSLVEYKNCKEKVRIVCPKHGEFWQAPEKHLKRRQGCFGCGWEKRAATNTERYGAPNVFQNEAIKKKSQQTMIRKYGVPFSAQSEELQDKRENTMLERYGGRNTWESKELRAKVDATMLDHYGNVCPMDCPEIAERRRRTCIERYGVAHPAQNPDILNKGFDVKKLHGTISSSKPEDEMYQVLCGQFGKENVLRNYWDPRYPFHCDFYVKTGDLFIELNASWTHGFHFFDENSEADKQTLAVWTKKAEQSKFYQGAIDVWTWRDLLKRDTAKKNGIHYIVFWKNDLSDFYAWIDKLA